MLITCGRKNGRMSKLIRPLNFPEGTEVTALQRKAGAGTALINVSINTDLISIS